jgi:hypothetical protein
MGCVGSPPASRRVAPMARVKRVASAKASAVIWRWRDGEAEVASRPSAASVRLRGSLQALLGYAVGVAFYLFWSKTVAAIAFALTTGVLLCALVSPHGLYALVRRLFDATGRVVGQAMTWIVMIPIFYLFFLPFGKLLRRGRNDRLRRYYEREAETYWEPHTPMQASSLERQF